MGTLDNWNKHVTGRKHRHKMALMEMKYTECPLCNVVFTGRAHMQDHIAGRKHRVPDLDSGYMNMHRRAFFYCEIFFSCKTLIR